MTASSGRRHDSGRLESQAATSLYGGERKLQCLLLRDNVETLNSDETREHLYEDCPKPC